MGRGSIGGPKAKFKGEGEYGFTLSACDDVADTFRTRIWKSATESVVYDNEIGEPDDSDAGTEIGGGNIVVHRNWHPKCVCMR